MGVSTIHNLICSLNGVNYNGSEYFYVFDLLGNVIGLMNESGQLVVTYTYDAWGNQRVVGSNGSENTLPTFIGNINPYRYLGYRYDAETGYYYLQARYYDPEIGRFISIDDANYISDDISSSINLYAYAANNPVMFVDPNGNERYHWAIAFGIVAVGIGVLVCTYGLVSAGISIYLAIYGFASFTSMSTILSFAVVGSMTALFGVALYASSGSNNMDDFFDQGEFALAATSIGVVFGAIGGYLAYNDQMTGLPHSWSKEQKDYWKSKGYESTPLGEDGKPIQLHHTYGRFGRKMTMYEEMTYTDHKSIHALYGYGNLNGGFNRYYPFTNWWGFINKF